MWILETFIVQSFYENVTAKCEKGQEGLTCGNGSDKISTSQSCVLSFALCTILLSLFHLFTYTAKIIPVTYML